MRPILALTLLLMVPTAVLASAGDGGRFSIGAWGSVTTASKLFANPNARDDLIRGTYTPIDPAWGAGADLRARVPAFGLTFGLSAEYVEGSVSSSAPNTSPPIPIEDGYVAIPVELSAFFSIPVGGETVDFYLGGGMGVYFGERKYRYAGVEAVTVERNLQPGIQVLTGIEYAIADAFALRSEIKFRNVHLETTQEFPSPSAVYAGGTVPLPQGQFTSRVQVDGMNLTLGLVWRIP